MPIRYIGEVHSPNYAVHTREFESLRHARETLADLPFGTGEDAILLFRCFPHESAGERAARVNDPPSHLLSTGPRGGVRTERL